MSASSSFSNPVGHLVGDHPRLVRVARLGWFAKGAVYVIAGVLALFVAAQAKGWSSSPAAGAQEASPTGALKTVAGRSGGPVLLVALAIGLLLYAMWRVVSAFLPGSGGAKAWAKRVGFIVSAVLYLSFAITALSLARGASPSSANGNATVAKTSGGVLQHTGGRLAIGLAGLIVVAVGIYRMSKGLKKDVADELDLSAVPAPRRRLFVRLGAIGEVGRGVGVSLIGYFLLRSAIAYDANKATGLDGALRVLVTKTGGALVVLVIGVGFVAYGLFCLATFTHRRLEAP